MDTGDNGTFRPLTGNADIFVHGSKENHRFRAGVQDMMFNTIMQ